MGDASETTYELKVEHIEPDESVDIPEGAFLPNLEGPNELGAMTLTYLAPVEGNE
jgi:hypothetical protein